jgi:hypothetical protein
VLRTQTVIDINTNGLGMMQEAIANAVTRR